MSQRWRRWAPALCALVANVASAAELNTLRDLKVVETPKGTQVLISGTKAPTFTVFRLSEPDRLVVDVSSADAASIKGHHDGRGPVKGIVASQFADERTSVARLMLALSGVSKYDVKADGKRVVVSVDGASTPTLTTEAVVPRMERPEVAIVAQAPTSAVAVVAEPQEEKAIGVVRSHLDEQTVKNPATKVIQVRYRKDLVQIRTNGEIAKMEILELENPPRLALDLFGMTSSARMPKVQDGLLADIRSGKYEDKVRLVMEARETMPAYRLARGPKGVDVRLSVPVPNAPVALQAESIPAVTAAKEIEGEAVVEIDGKKIAIEAHENAPLPVKPSNTQAKVIDVKDLMFHESTNGGTVELKLSGDVEYKIERPDAQSAVLTLSNARLPKKLERSLDTSALDTPVKMISAFATPGGENLVRVVVAAESTIEQTMSKKQNVLSWKLSSKVAKTEEVSVVNAAAGFATEAPAYASEGAPRKTKFTGRRVSFEFKDIDIHNLLRVIAEVSKKNIVVADDVSGKVTIRLRNVPWDQALELILRSKSLGKEEIGNIVRVAPLKALEEEAKIRADRAKAMLVQEPLTVHLLPVNYAEAGEMAARVKEVLTERGSVTVDTRTNVLVVKDIAANILKAKSLVEKLDTQTPQVLIESRIVEASTNFSRQIGVQWGGFGQMAPNTGNATGLAFPNTFRVAGGSTSDQAVGTADSPNFAVNLPAAVGTGAGGALGFVFGSAGGAVGLNLRLSAMEAQGAVKTISAPKVTTLDNKAARISQGVSIPFSQVSASGVNTAFVEARLSLEVTPHITQDGSIMMTISAQNNQPDPSATGANGQPAIQKKEASTQVLVKDGDTTVIGGIYVKRASSSQSLVPFFGRIPILGFFFKNHTEADSRTELLIFITPRIINRQTMAQTL